MKRNPLHLALIALTFLLVSCGHKTDLSGLKEVSYANDIQPIVAANCTQSGCHSGGGELFSLTTYDEVINQGEVQSGDAHGSKFYQVVSNRLFAQLMPPSTNPPLSDDQVKLIYLWIQQGAKNN